MCEKKSHDFVPISSKGKFEKAEAEEGGRRVEGLWNVARTSSAEFLKTKCVSGSSISFFRYAFLHADPIERKEKLWVTPTWCFCQCRLPLPATSYSPQFASAAGLFQPFRKLFNIRASSWWNCVLSDYENDEPPCDHRRGILVDHGYKGRATVNNPTQTLLDGQRGWLTPECLVDLMCGCGRSCWTRRNVCN